MCLLPHADIELERATSGGPGWPFVSSSGSKQPTRGEILGVGPSGPQPFIARSAPPVGPETRSVDRLGRRAGARCSGRSEEHTSELQSRQYLVCRLLLEKKKI